MLAFSLALPITDPVFKFLIILAIILAAPLLLNKLRIPHLIGLIIAGAVIGPHGFNVISRDSSIILSGTAGLLYIMFLAGLEIDLNDFKKNSWKSLIFGIYTFCIPMALGIAVGYYVLHFSMLTSILLASMFASHTLIAYPIVSKFGISRDIAVNITVGGTVITDTLALLVLTIIVGMSTGKADEYFWYRLGGSVAVFGLFVMLVFPVIGRWFFKRVEDNVSQYIFVLVMVFLGSCLAQIAGLEAIIGAFLAGMAMNRLIPASSPLMNRVEFVGNAIFIPFFLISVGMLIDYRAFFTNWETIEVGVIMIAVATLAKFLAAWLTQKTFRFSADQRRVIFGLSNAQAAATLAAVLVGYNVIIGYGADGEPIRLLNDSVLNGTILMILVTCTTASLVAQKGAADIALSDVSQNNGNSDSPERILITVNNDRTVTELVNLSTAIQSRKNKTGLYALHVIDSRLMDEKKVKNAQKMLQEAVSTAAATDHYLNGLLRYDISGPNAVIGVVREHNITDLIMGLPRELPEGVFLNRNIEWILSQCNANAYIYKTVQPLSTVRRHLIVIPDKAEKDLGFTLWIRKIWNISYNTGAGIVFYTSAATRSSLEEIHKRRSIKADFVLFDDWNDFLIISRDIKKDDALWVILSRKEKLSYQPAMNNIPQQVAKYMEGNNCILLYPVQTEDADSTNRYLT